MSKKPTKKRLYHLMLNSIPGACYYNLFVENDQIVAIELSVFHGFPYDPELDRFLSDKALLPCGLEEFKSRLTALLKKCDDSLSIDYNIHSTNRAMLRSIKNFKSHFSK